MSQIDQNFLYFNNRLIFRIEKKLHRMNLVSKCKILKYFPSFLQLISKMGQTMCLILDSFYKLKETGSNEPSVKKQFYKI